MAISPRSSALLNGDDVLESYRLNSALRKTTQPTTREQWAKALLQQGSAGTPVSSPLEGLAKMLTAGVGGYIGGEERRAGEQSEAAMLADIMGRKSQQQAEEQRQLAGLGVPGFNQPPPQVEPGVARAVPTATGGVEAVPQGFDPPPTRAPANVDAALIQAVAAMQAGGNKTAGSALPGLQFAYGDQRDREREAKADAREAARDARAAASASREPDQLRILRGLGIDPTSPQARELLFPKAGGPPPSDFERVLEGSGYVKGSPEWQDMMKKRAEAIAKGSGTTVNVGGVEKALDKELGTQTAKQLTQFRDDALAAEKAIEASSRILQAINAGAITGVGADWRMNASRVLAAAGLIDGSRVKSTEALIGELARGTLAAGADLKGAMSDKDIMFLREVAQGNLALTSDTLRRAADLASRGNARLMQRYNDAVQSIYDDPATPAPTRSLYKPMAVPELGAPPTAAGPGGVGTASPPAGGGWRIRPVQ